MATTMNSKGIGDSVNNRQYGAKSNDAVIRVIQEMLMARCKEEPDFLMKMSRPDRSMEQAINYLCNTIQKMGVCVVDDSTVLGILSDYFDGDFDEDSTKPFNCNIVVSKPELSDEDKAELREQAMKEYKEEQLRAIRRDNQQKASSKSTSSQKKRKSMLNKVISLGRTSKQLED